MTTSLIATLAQIGVYIPEVTTGDRIRAWLVIGLIAALAVTYCVLRKTIGRVRARRFTGPFALAGAALLVAGGLWEESLESLTSSFFKGLTEGGIYALIAVGYTMVYGVVKLINFAHGEIFMLAAFMMYALMAETPAGPALGMTLIAFVVIFGASWVIAGEKRRPGLKTGVSFGAAVPLAICFYLLFRFVTLPFIPSVILSIILSASLGMTCDLVAYKPLRTAPRLSALLTAIGLSIAFQNIALLIWGGDAYRLPVEEIPAVLVAPALPAGGTQNILWSEMLFKYYRLRILGAEIGLLEIITILVSFAAMGVLWYIVAKTKVGKAMRATAMDKQTAALMGVSVNRTVAATFIIGSSFAAVGAAFYFLEYPSALTNLVGYQVGIIAFAAAVLGGIGSIPGACIGGYLIGFAMTLEAKLKVATLLAALGLGDAIKYLPELSLSQWEYGFPYVIMILVIIFRPSGILGREEAAARA